MLRRAIVCSGTSIASYCSVRNCLVERHQHLVIAACRLARRFHIAYRTSSSATCVQDQADTAYPPSHTYVSTTRMLDAVVQEIPPAQQVYLVSRREMELVVSLMRDELGAHDQQIAQLLVDSPVVLQRPASAWHAVVTGLQQEGVPPSCVLSCLSAAGACLLDADLAAMRRVVRQLPQRLGVREHEVHTLIARAPHVLLCDERHLVRQLSELRRLFTAQQAGAVLLRCPHVLLATPTQTRALIDYCNFDMCITPRDMVMSDVFACQLLHVYTRHTVLLRAGVFRPQNPKSTAPSANPSLQAIVSGSDEAFCRKVAGISYKEYEVLSRMLEEEFEQQQHQDTDDEDEATDGDVESLDYNSSDDEHFT